MPHFRQSRYFLANRPWIRGSMRCPITSHCEQNQVISVSPRQGRGRHAGASQQQRPQQQRCCKAQNLLHVRTRGLDNSTRSNFFTQLIPLLLEDSRSCAMDRNVLCTLLIIFLSQSSFSSHIYCCCTLHYKCILSICRIQMSNLLIIIGLLMVLSQ